MLRILASILPRIQTTGLLFERLFYHFEVINVELNWTFFYDRFPKIIFVLRVFFVKCQVRILIKMVDVFLGAFGDADLLFHFGESICLLANSVVH